MDLVMVTSFVKTCLNKLIIQEDWQVCVGGDLRQVSSKYPWNIPQTKVCFWNYAEKKGKAAYFLPGVESEG